MKIQEHPLETYLRLRGESQTAFVLRANEIDLIAPPIRQSMVSSLFYGNGCSAGAAYRIIKAVEMAPHNEVSVTLPLLVEWAMGESE